MQEKTKKWLLSLAVRTAVSAGVFAVIFIVCKLFPQMLQHIQPMWTKSMDIQKIGGLFKQILKGALP